MNTLSAKTRFVTTAEAEKQWVVVDATDQLVGRLCSKVAKILRGKYKPCFTPNQDCGDNVIIINAEKVVLTGNKFTQKYYMRYTGYPGGQRTRTVAEQMKRKPVFVLEHAVRGMLPKNKLGDAIFKNLYVYEGTDHKHEAQQPQELKINTHKQYNK